MDVFTLKFKQIELLIRYWRGIVKFRHKNPSFCKCDEKKNLSNGNNILFINIQSLLWVYLKKNSMMFLFAHLGNILPCVCLLVKCSAQLIISKHISISSQSSERVKVTQRKLFLFILLLKEDEIDAGNMKMNKHFTAIANFLLYEYIIRILQYKKT